MSTTTARRTTARWLTVALALLAGAAAATAVAGSAWAVDDCDGVVVVVDAGELGGPQTTRCAEGNPGSGLAALTAAGHDYSFVPRIPGMVCTIDARPDPCNGAPADAYWSYWHAEAGGSWSYSSRGAGERDPQPGSVEGWAFGAGDPPRAAPPAFDGGGDDEDAHADDGGGSDSGDADGDGGGTGSGGGSGSGQEGGGTAATSDDQASTGGDDGSDTDGGGDHAAPDDGGADGDDAGSGADPAEAELPEADRQSDVTRDPRAGDGSSDAASDTPSDGPADGDGADPDDEVASAADVGDDLDDADEVAVGAPSGGGWTGFAVGATLFVAVAGAALLSARRRRMEP